MLFPCLVDAESEASLMLFPCLVDAESEASLLADRDVLHKIKCLIDIERKLRLELAEHEKKVRVSPGKHKGNVT